MLDKAKQDEYLERMAKILLKKDWEGRHVDMDWLLIEIIKDNLGIDFTKTYDETEMWYA